MSDLFIQRSAIFSECGAYRFRLDRVVGQGGITASFGGVNPSTADAAIDDQTIKKLYGFGRALGVTTWLVWNPFAYRATNVRDLAHVEDPVGPDNDSHIEEMLRASTLHIVGWGALNKLPPRLRGRWRAAVAIADRVGCDLKCWGTNLDGHPRHPQMIGYDSPLIRWERP